MPIAFLITNIEEKYVESGKVKSKMKFTKFEALFSLITMVSIVSSFFTKCDRVNGSTEPLS